MRFFITFVFTFAVFHLTKHFIPIQLPQSSYVLMFFIDLVIYLLALVPCYFIVGFVTKRQKRS